MNVAFNSIKHSYSNCLTMMQPIIGSCFYILLILIDYVRALNKMRHTEWSKCGQEDFQHCCHPPPLLPLSRPRLCV